MFLKRLTRGFVNVFSRQSNGLLDRPIGRRRVAPSDTSEHIFPPVMYGRPPVGKDF
jgi:hypothetical protein